MKKRIINFLVDAVVGAAIGLGIALILTNFGSIVVVKGQSMESSIKDGSVGIIQKISLNLKRGDIVSVDIINVQTNEKMNILKRIIGLPGETVTIKNNEVYINGTKIEENYIKEKMNTNDMEIRLGFDDYFVMGDNRNNSYDSRIHGVIHRSQIVGKMILVANMEVLR